MWKINRVGLDLIKRFEGLKLDAYLCPSKIWTIGFGHTKDVEKWDKISPEIAESLLREDLEYASKQVEELVDVTLDDNQFATLVSFVFNCGVGNFKSSTLLKLLNTGAYYAVPTQLRRWTKITVNGKKVTLKGLVRRREAESNLWETPDEIEPEENELMAQKINNVDEVGSYVC